jgi:hypothetical protein
MQAPLQPLSETPTQRGATVQTFLLSVYTWPQSLRETKVYAAMCILDLWLSASSGMDLDAPKWTWFYVTKIHALKHKKVSCIWLYHYFFGLNELTVNPFSFFQI